jgi:hypothetical protein
MGHAQNVGIQNLHYVRKLWGLLILKEISIIANQAFERTIVQYIGCNNG